MTTRREPNVWHSIPADDIRTWRQTLAKGARRETQVGRRNLPSVDLDLGEGTGGFAPQDRPKPLEGRETVERVAADLLAWARSSPDQFMARVRLLKAQGAMPHLTDAEAAEQLHTLALKIAQGSAERVFTKQGRAGITIRGGVLLGE